jgi:acetylornithine deacetylase/succinyl-diaminopimelate desuccinylase-like protein
MVIRMPEQAEFLALLTRLAETPGPSLEETPRRQVLEAFFDGHHVPWQTDDAGNLIVILGEGPFGDMIVLDAHIDVVECGYCPQVREENGWLRGLGVADDLAAVSTLAFLACRLSKHAASLQRPLCLLFSVGEEGYGDLKGARYFVDTHTVAPHAFISLDLSIEDCCVSALGSYRDEVLIGCPGGHSWDDYGRPNAARELVDYLSRVAHAHAELAARSQTLITFNIGQIEGGQSINVICREAMARFEFRSVSEPLLKQMADSLATIDASISNRDDVSLARRCLGRRPAAAAVDGDGLEALARSAYAQHGVKLNPSRPRSTNINIPLAAGWPSICLGICKCHDFHSAEESLEIASLATGWDVLQSLLRGVMAGPAHINHQ